MTTTNDLLTHAIAQMQSDGTPMGNLKGWLRMQVAMTEAMTTINELPPLGWHYKNVEDLVLHAGTAFTPRPCPAGYDKGVLKECYANSFLAAVTDPGLRYVEGYGITDIGMALGHAWNITEDDQVVDRTWQWQDTDPKAHFYAPEGVLLGVVVPTSLLWAVWKRREYVGVLADYEHGFPALHHEWNPEMLKAAYKAFPLRHEFQTTPRRTRTSGKKRAQSRTA